MWSETIKFELSFSNFNTDEKKSQLNILINVNNDVLRE